MSLTAEQAVEELKRICNDCGKFETNRAACAECRIESWRQQIVIEIQSEIGRGNE